MSGREQRSRLVDRLRARDLNGAPISTEHGLCTVHDMQHGSRAASGAPESSFARSRRVAMVARLVGVQITTAMVVLGIPPLIPAIRSEFDLSRGASGLLVTAVFVGVVAASWPAGRIVDAVGVRRSLMWACAGLGVSLALTGLTSTYVGLLVGLCVVGLFYGPITPATNAGVVAWASKGFRTRAMAIKQMGVTAGAAVSAASIPLLTTRFGWRAAVAILGTATVVGGMCCAQWFQRPPSER